MESYGSKYAACGQSEVRIYDYSGHIKEASQMREIQLRDAKASLSAVIDSAVQGEPAVITRHGKPEAVILSFREWERLSRVPSFGRLLMGAPIESADLPTRDQTPVRTAEL